MPGLKIALIAPPWFAVPPTGYGGIEWVVSLLAEGLVRRGHDVALFASGGSVTAARLLSTYETPPSEKLGDWPIEAAAILDAYALSDRFDVIHDHTLLGLLAARLAEVPVVHTAHGVITPAVAALYERVSRQVRLVTISASQEAAMPPGCARTVIHNGVDLGQFAFSPGAGDYLLFVGRMSEEKGVITALEIARQAGKRLLVLGKVNEPAERVYFESQVRPRLAAAGAAYVEQPLHSVKVAAYQGALATLFPIHWEEPFGLVMVESMACGTPVIAFRRGSVPEVIRHGVTGEICDSVEEAVAAVARVRQLSRQACRDHACENFSAELMVSRYEALYSQVARGKGAPGPGIVLPAVKNAAGLAP